jgi:hypothetical protein
MSSLFFPSPAFHSHPTVSISIQNSHSTVLIPTPSYSSHSTIFIPFSSYSLHLQPPFHNSYIHFIISISISRPPFSFLNLHPQFPFPFPVLISVFFVSQLGEDEAFGEGKEKENDK